MKNNLSAATEIDVGRSTTLAEDPDARLLSQFAWINGLESSPGGRFAGAMVKGRCQSWPHVLGNQRGVDRGGGSEPVAERSFFTKLVIKEE